MTAGDASFPLFGPSHIVAIVATGVAAAGLSVLLRRTANRPWAPVLQRVMCLLLALALLAAWITEDVLLTFRGYGTWQDSLPLHLCDLALLLAVVTLFGLASSPQPAAPLRKPADFLQTCYELAYFWSLAGSTQALLTPDITQPFPSFVCVRFFFTHGGALVATLVLTIGLGLRPRRHAVWRTWLITAGLAVVVMFVNWLLDANYMYLCGPPKEASLYDYLGPWPWTLLSVAALGWVLFGLCYAPFWIGGRR